MQRRANADLAVKNLAERQVREQAQQRLAQIEKGVELFAGLVRGLNPRSEELGGPPLYEQLRQRAVKAADELVGEAVGDPEAVARLQTLLGRTLVELGDSGKAVEVLEQASKTRQSLLGADHPDTLDPQDGLASAYQAAGKVPEAIALFERVRDAKVNKLGPDHPDTLTTVGNLAWAYQAAGKLPEATALHEALRDARVKKLGADHPDTLKTLNNLAAAYYSAGKLAEAIALFERVRDAKVKKLGPDHPDTLTTVASLAKTYQAAGKLDQALPLYAQAAAGIEKRQFQHYAAGGIIPETSAAYEQAKQFDQAEAWRRKWLAAVKTQSGADSPAYAVALAGPGGNLLQQKKWPQAEGMLNESLALCRKTQPDDWSTFNAMSLLGEALLGQRQDAAAEPLLVQGFEGMKQRAGKIPRRLKGQLSQAADRLIALYEARGQSVEAARWRKERQALEAAAAPKEVKKP